MADRQSLSLVYLTRMLERDIADKLTPRSIALGPRVQISLTISGSAIK